MLVDFEIEARHVAKVLQPGLLEFHGGRLDAVLELVGLDLVELFLDLLQIADDVAPQEPARRLV